MEDVFHLLSFSSKQFKSKFNARYRDGRQYHLFPNPLCVCVSHSVMSDSMQPLGL